MHLQNREAESCQLKGCWGNASLSLVRNRDGNIITEEDECRERLGEYFHRVPNEENESYALCEMPQTEEPTGAKRRLE